MAKIPEMRKALAGGASAGGLTALALGLLVYSLANNNGWELSEAEAAEVAGLIIAAGTVIAGIVGGVVYQVANTPNAPLVIRQIVKSVWGQDVSEAQIIEVLNFIERLLRDAAGEDGNVHQLQR